MSKSWLSRLSIDEEGSTAVEYGLLGALVATVIAGAVLSLGVEVRLLYEQACVAVTGAVGGGAC